LNTNTLDPIAATHSRFHAKDVVILKDFVVRFRRLIDFMFGPNFVLIILFALETH